MCIFYNTPPHRDRVIIIKLLVVKLMFEWDTYKCALHWSTSTEREVDSIPLINQQHFCKIC